MFEYLEVRWNVEFMQLYYTKKSRRFSPVYMNQNSTTISSWGKDTCRGSRNTRVPTSYILYIQLPFLPGPSPNCGDGR